MAARGEVAAGEERVSHVDIAVVGGAFVVGIALRVWVLRSPLGVLDSDEAVVGLMARRLAFHGRISPFFLGQLYGGSIEAILTAAVFRVFGPSVLALKLVPLLLSLPATGLVGLIGRRLLTARRGLYAAAAFWICNGNYVWWSTKARAFYWTTTILGLLIVLLALRVIDRPNERRTWLALGCAVGLGWWTSPQILFFLVPVAGWLLVKLRTRVARPAVVWALPAAVVGALPWIASNVRTQLGSLAYGQKVPGSFATRLEGFFRQGLPVMFGFHASETWLLKAFFQPVYVVVGLVLAYAVVRHRRRLGLIAAFIVVYPLIFASFPTSWAIGEGRYLLYLLGPVLIAFAAVPGRRLVLPLILPFILGVTVVDLRHIENRSRPLAVDILVPDDDRGLRRALEEEQIRYAWADYWIAYRVMFEMDERVSISPDEVGKIRDQPLAERVQASDRAARIAVVGSTVDVTLAARLPGVAPCVRRRQEGGYVVYFRDPSRRTETAADGLPCPDAAKQFLQI